MKEEIEKAKQLLQEEKDKKAAEFEEKLQQLCEEHKVELIPQAKIGFKFKE